MSEAVEELAERSEHAVTPLELFFDLVFVFAITQVTSLITHDPTWHGVFRAMLAAMTAMLGVALAVPAAFGDDAVLFGVCFLLVRVFHVVLYTNAGRGDHDLVGAVLRLAPAELAGATLILVAAFLSGDARIALWMLALVIDYVGPAVVTLDGWRIAPEHFSERHGLIVLIALGESIIAIGIGAGLELTAGVIVGAVLGVVVVSALWWLYFDVAAIITRTRLVDTRGVDQIRLARDAYSYLHMPMVAGIVLFAFGLKTTLHHVHDELDVVAAVALCGGTAVYLLAHVAFLVRATRRIFRLRTIGGVVLLLLVPVAGA